MLGRVKGWCLRLLHPRLQYISYIFFYKVFNFALYRYFYPTSILSSDQVYLNSDIYNFLLQEYAPLCERRKSINNKHKAFSIQ